MTRVLLQPAGTVGNVISSLPFFNVNQYGADPTGSADSTTAFEAAYAAATATLSSSLPGAFVTMGAGTYKVAAGNLIANDPRIGLLGPASSFCTVQASGAGDVFYHNTPSAEFSTRHFGTKIGGFTIDGTNCTAAATGLHIQDIGSFPLVDLSLQNFTASRATTLSSDLSTGSPITSLPINALADGLPYGSYVIVSSGANNQTWVTTAPTAVGATTLAVQSQTPNFAYLSGSAVTPASSIGLSFTGGGGWSEKLQFLGVAVGNNSIGVCFDGAGATSYDYMRCLDLFANVKPGQVGVMLRNFAQLDQPAAFNYTYNSQRANAGPTSTALVIGPTNNAGDQSRIRNANLAIKGEGDGATSTAYDLQVGQFAQLHGQGVLWSFGMNAGAIASSQVNVGGIVNTPALTKTQPLPSPVTTQFPVVKVASGEYVVAAQASTSTATGWTLGQVFFAPLDVPAPQAFSGLSTSVSILGAGGTTPLVVMGLYPDDGSGSKPNVASGPTIPTLTTPAGFNTQVSSDPTAGTTSTRDLAWGTAQTLAPGRYWVALMVQSGTAFGTSPTIVTLNPGQNIGLDGLTNVSHRGWSITSVVGNNLPTSGSLFRAGGSWPIAGLKAQ